MKATPGQLYLYNKELDERKVYCKECGYFSVWNFRCSHPSVIKYEHTPYQKTAIYGDIKILNKDNHCMLYKKHEKHEEAPKVGRKMRFWARWYNSMGTKP